MKPEPYITPLPRALTAEELIYLQIGEVNLRGVSSFAIARRLEKLGLGTVSGKVFSVSAAGLTAVADL